MKIIKAFIHNIILSFVTNKVFSTHKFDSWFFINLFNNFINQSKNVPISTRFLIKICTTSFLQNFMYKILYLILVYVCPFID